MSDRSPPASLSSLEQSLTGRYAFERELGRGGTAIVWQVRDEKHDRQVALKILKPEVAAIVGPERFQREVRTAARLQHPHIATVYDSGSDDGVLWFSMPFVDGGTTLREHLARRGRLEVGEVLRLAREIGQALQYAHDHGVLHRDVKPENVLLAPDGTALVTDFGLARTLDADDTRLTESGIALGTPAYMSPEQIRGDGALDARSDQFSLACTLFELLAGRRPFEGGQGLAFVARRLTEPAPALADYRGDVPPAVAAALARAMAIEPEDRFPSIRDFLGALTGEELSGGRVVSGGARARRDVRVAVQTTPVARRSGERPAHGDVAGRGPSTGALVAGVVLVATAVGVLGWSLLRRAPARDATPTVAATDDGRVALAVLPFAFAGDSTVAYFADGLASEIRSRLAMVPALRVTATASSNQYRATGRPLVEVGRELGARYLLTGQVESSLDSTGARRLRIRPELVEATTGASAWSGRYEAGLTDVFAVQAQVAEQVAQALGIALEARQKAQLSALPTRDIAAYDAFLRGEAISQQRSVRDPPTLRRALAAYVEAFTRDSSFLLAWARAVNVGATLWFNKPPDAALADTLRGYVAQAVRLDPQHPATLSALGDYQLLVQQDQERALESLTAGLALTPDDPALLNSAATADRVVGRWADSRARLERLVRLDPRSPAAFISLGRTLLWTHDLPAARRAFARALELAPANLGARQHLAMSWLAEGRLDSARAVIRAVPPTVAPEALVTFFGTYWELAWALERPQLELLVRQRPDRFEGDLGNWGLVLAQAYASLGDSVRMRAYADSGQRAMMARIRANPDDWQQHILRGLALAYAGRRDEAIREGEQAVALRPLARDASFGAYALFTLARIYALAGESAKARATLAQILAVPFYATPAWVTVDPAFRAAGR